MFGNSLEAHHLLYAYISVWLIQGGYCAWVAWQWLHAKKGSRAEVTPHTEDF
jgi:hypothetical protein